MPIRLAQAHLVPWESYVVARFCKKPLLVSDSIRAAIFSTLSKPTIGQNRRLNRKTNSLR